MCGAGAGWDGLRGGLEVCGCGVGAGKISQTRGCGAGLNFAAAGREGTKNFKSRRTLTLNPLIDKNVTKR